MKPKKFDKKELIVELQIIGAYIRKYNMLYILLLLVIAFFEVAMMIRGIIRFDFSEPRRVSFFVSYVCLFIASLAVALFILFDRKKKFSLSTVAIVVHFYCAFIVAWATLISLLDLQKDGYPIVYLTIVLVIGGIVVINPYFYAGIVAISSVCLMILKNPNNTILITSGDYINIFVFIVMSLFVAYRMYRVSVNEAKTMEYLHSLSKKDMMTGLGNETSYIEITEKIDDTKEEYGVIVMDLNGLKNTNDTYGHRYGTKLLVATGEVLKEVLKDSYLFHVGGDEFVAILKDNDYKNKDELVLKVKEKLELYKFMFDGVELILSVAVGFAIKQKGETYKNVFQEADDLMYKNKAIVKEKYHIASRNG